MVVSVITEEPTIRNASRIAIKAACFTPSTVRVSFQILISGVPGVRNILKTTVIRSRTMIAFNPFIIKRKGTLEALITTVRKTAATRYIRKERCKNREMMKVIVPTSFTLGSSRWITDSAG